MLGMYVQSLRSRFCNEVPFPVWRCRMNVQRIVAFTLLASVFGLPLFSNSKALSQVTAASSRIAGIVLDANDARIVNASIKVQNANFTRRLRSNDEGMFELELPPGVYQIIAEQPGFKKFQLASFEVKAGAKDLLKIHMEVDTPKTPLKVHQGFAQKVAAAHY